MGIVLSPTRSSIIEVDSTSESIKDSLLVL